MLGGVSAFMTPGRIMLVLAIAPAAFALALTLLAQDGDSAVIGLALLAAIVGCATGFLGWLAAPARVEMAIAVMAILIDLGVLVYWAVVIVHALQTSR
jgi:hypothetical protein